MVVDFLNHGFGSRRTERGPIVEREPWLVLSESKLGLECIDLPPVPQHFLLSLGKVDAHDFALAVLRKSKMFRRSLLVALLVDFAYSTRGRLSFLAQTSGCCGVLDGGGRWEDVESELEGGGWAVAQNASLLVPAVSNQRRANSKVDLTSRCITKSAVHKCLIRSVPAGYDAFWQCKVITAALNSTHNQVVQHIPSP